MRLIDADAVANDIRKHNRDNFDRLDWSSNEVCQLLESAPVVDAVPVVQCKDCKNNGCCSIQDAMNWTPRLNIGKWFCSFGEKK